MVYYKIVFIQLLFIFSLILCQNRNSPDNSLEQDDVYTVNITIFYETLCPGSIQFFKEQLGPTVLKLSSHLNIHLVPYGFALVQQQNERYDIKCQHGHSECIGNKLHACVIDKLQNVTKSTLLNTCLIQEYTSYRNLQWCSNILGIKRSNRTKIWNCLRSKHGFILLNRHGKETRQLQPEYLPYVLVNGSPDHNAFSNLMTSVCNVLQPIPSACEQK